MFSIGTKTTVQIHYKILQGSLIQKRVVDAATSLQIESFPSFNIAHKHNVPYSTFFFKDLSVTSFQIFE